MVIPAKGVKTESAATQSLLRELTKKKIAYLLSKHTLKDVDVYTLIKEFFKEYLHANYEFTFDELADELKKTYIEKDLKENLFKLLKDFSTIEYKDEEIPQDVLRNVLNTFSRLIDELIKESEQKKGFFSQLFGGKKELPEERRPEERPPSQEPLVSPPAHHERPEHHLSEEEILKGMPSRAESQRPPSEAGEAQFEVPSIEQPEQQAPPGAAPDQRPPVPDEHQEEDRAPQPSPQQPAADDQQPAEKNLWSEEIMEEPSPDASEEEPSAPAQQAPPEEQPEQQAPPAEEQPATAPTQETPTPAQPATSQAEDTKVYFGEEEQRLSQDLNTLASQLDDVIKTQGDTQAPVAPADTIEQLITTVERLVTEHQHEEAHNVYKELLGRYNELSEEDKHRYYDSIQHLYTLLQQTH
ncbi:hypothetical protein GF367_04450 [Candidatus Woesearchaeota archaeon]|nr:hypothetical protein [Candidatus Woesearchaeota archaeon]